MARGNRACYWTRRFTFTAVAISVLVIAGSPQSHGLPETRMERDVGDVAGSGVQETRTSIHASVDSSSSTASVQRLLHAAKQLRSRGQQMLSAKDIHRALYLGDTERIRNFVRRMAEGENLTIALLGGSVSKGMGAVSGEPSFEVWLQRWLAAVAPGGGPHNASTVRVVNAACAATSSAYMNMCLREYLPDDDIDLVIVEYAINDHLWPHPPWENEERRSLEQLLRKLLKLPKHPAVVLLNMYRWHNDFVLPSHTKSLGVYYTNTEGDFFELSTYYGLQLISVKAAVFRKMVAGSRGFQVHSLRHLHRDNLTSDPEAFFYEDPMHPTGLTGHRVLSELITGLLVNVARSLVLRPWRQLEAEAVAAPLPAHMITHNKDTDLDQCVLGDKFRTAAVEVQGFTWLNEGRNPLAPKWGFTATEVGSSITFGVSQGAVKPDGAGTLTGPAKPRAAFVLVILAYLRSYEKMGVAEVACSGGCLCGPQAQDIIDPAAAAAAAAATSSQTVALLDGHWEDASSQLQLGCFQARLLPPAGCNVTVRVAGTTRSGGHKVKLGGLIVSHTAPGMAENMCRDNLEAAQRAAGFRER